MMQYWCWISERYAGERVAGEYVWLWLALFSSFLVYIPLFLWSEGYLRINVVCWWRFHFSYRRKLEVYRGSRRRTVAILAYPATYALLVCPVSIIRWIGFGLEARGQSIPSAATFISISIFALSGLSNVLLLVTTRPNLLLFGSVPGLQTDHENSQEALNEQSGVGATEVEAGIVAASRGGVAIGITQETVIGDPGEDMVYVSLGRESQASSSTMVSDTAHAMERRETDAVTQHKESPSTSTTS